MAKYFPTRLKGCVSHEESEEWAALRKHWLEKNCDALGRTRYYAQKYSGEGPILQPAGSWMYEPLSERQDAKELTVYCRMVEIARDGCPDLFEAKLTLLDHENRYCQDISESVPAHSLEEATDRFKAALASERASAMAAFLGDTPFVRAFGVAVSPECLTEQLKRTPAPTSSEIRQLSEEFSQAVAGLFDVIDRWEGTDALAYLRLFDGTRGALGRLEHERARQTGIARLSDLKTDSQVRAIRRGRPLKAGAELALAHALADIWRNCGLGEPKLSAQSRFIRACGLALPWHNVFKADVAQFMRGEARKTRRRSVVID
ncbi:hypothetical protein [Dyella lutea]|uniref:Uncharacterized protein n=1 Tax=Dyella lutea TaxID=2950441 RepID=A0ABT1F5K9_9GAMM|nr:hypothetical protein [Dyella lutea]MCP1372625.1 hypothetical protein [Dyella lutea]